MVRHTDGYVNRVVMMAGMVFVVAIVLIMVTLSLTVLVPWWCRDVILIVLVISSWLWYKTYKTIFSTNLHQTIPHIPSEDKP